jgi:hypothetical protein
MKVTPGLHHHDLKPVRTGTFTLVVALTLKALNNDSSRPTPARPSGLATWENTP